MMNVDGQPTVIDEKHAVNFVDSFHRSWINSLHVNSTVSNYGARILKCLMKFSQQNQMVNSLRLDEIETQGNLYGYYNESRALQTSASRNTDLFAGCDYIWGNSAARSTNSSVERKEILLAANVDQKGIAFRINHPFFNVNDVLLPTFGIRITLTPHNTYTSCRYHLG